MTDNNPEQIRLRRDQNTLRIVGTGTIAFGIWSLVKFFGVLLVKKQEIITEIYEEMYDSNPEMAETYKPLIFKVLLIFILIAILIELAARLFIGLSAISEGGGKRRGVFYLIIACIMIVFSFLSSIAIMTRMVSADYDPSGAVMDDTSVSSLIVELTSMIMMIEMVAASVSVRRSAGKERNRSN